MLPLKLNSFVFLAFIHCDKWSLPAPNVEWLSANFVVYEHSFWHWYILCIHSALRVSFTKSDELKMNCWLHNQSVSLWNALSEVSEVLGTVVCPTFVCVIVVCPICVCVCVYVCVCYCKSLVAGSMCGRWVLRKSAVLLLSVCCSHSLFVHQSASCIWGRQGGGLICSHWL